MTSFANRFAAGLVCILASALVACGGSGGGIDDQSQASVGDTGFLNLSVSDAPIKDAEKVCVRFDGLELKHADSDDREVIDFDAPKVINLLAHQGADSHPIVTGAELPAGRYAWIRLKVLAERGFSGGVNDPNDDTCDEEAGNSYLVRTSSNGAHNLFIPSGSQRGLQLIKDIVIPANRSGDYTAEWDLGKSFNAPPGLQPDVMMKPVIKLVANNEVGTLEGQVDNGLIVLDSCDAEFAPSVYVFDDGVEPNPFDDPFAADDAVATGLVEEVTLDNGLMQWRYSIGFLLSGNYEAAYTCNGTDFIPLAGKAAEIRVNDVETVDFFAKDAPPPVGSLSGVVESGLVTSSSCNKDFDEAVYVFGEGVKPDAAADVIATGLVESDNPNEEFRYLIEGLPAGNYTAAFTCTGDVFVPDLGKEAVITAGQDKPLDFTSDDAS
jgi:hypothetical protein